MEVLKRLQKLFVPSADGKKEFICTTDDGRVMINYHHEKDQAERGPFRYIELVDGELRCVGVATEFLEYDTAFASFHLTSSSKGGPVICMNELDSYLLNMQGIGSLAFIHMAYNRFPFGQCNRSRYSGCVVPAPDHVLTLDERFDIAALVGTLWQRGVDTVYLLKGGCSVAEIIGDRRSCELNELADTLKLGSYSQCASLVDKYFADTYANRLYAVRELLSLSRVKPQVCGITRRILGLNDEKDVDRAVRDITRRLKEIFCWEVTEADVLGIVELLAFAAPVNFVAKAASAGFQQKALLSLRGALECVDDDGYYLEDMIIKHVVRALRCFNEGISNPFYLVFIGERRALDYVGDFFQQLSLHPDLYVHRSGIIEQSELFILTRDNFFVHLDGLDVHSSGGLDVVNGVLRLASEHGGFHGTIDGVPFKQRASLFGTSERPIADLPDNIIPIKVKYLEHDKSSKAISSARDFFYQAACLYASGSDGSLSDSEKLKLQINGEG